MAPALAADGRAVVLLEPDGPPGLVGAALAASSAGWRVVDARLAEAGARTGGSIELVAPTGRLGPGPRTRADRLLAPTPGGSGDPRTIPGRGIFGAPEALDGRFSPTEAARAVTEAAVAVLQARGEPAERDRLLGPVIVALDRCGQLHRFATASAEPALVPEEASAATGATVPPDEPARRGPRRDPGPGAGVGAATPGAAATRALLELVDGELLRPDHRRLAASDEGRLWLADPHDEAAAAAPLADRLEWAVFSLLGTEAAASEAALREGIGAMFAGSDTPDPWLMDACLKSYAEPGIGRPRLAAVDHLQHRAEEHTATIALLADIGHALGLHVGHRAARAGTPGGRPAARRPAWPPTSVAPACPSSDGPAPTPWSWSIASGTRDRASRSCSRWSGPRCWANRSSSAAGESRRMTGSCASW